MLSAFRQFLAMIMATIYSFMGIMGITPKTQSTTKDSSFYHKADIQNVIFMIGDGMGFNSIEKTKKENGVELTIDTFEFQGSSRTRSSSSSVTDSAAGATALACATRTTNNVVGNYPTDFCGVESHPKSISELCKENNMKVGIVTTDKTTGATPAGFSAHTSARGNNKEIVEDQLKTNFDLIWGAADSKATVSSVEGAGFTYVATTDEMNGVTLGEKSYAQFAEDLWHLTPGENTPNLEQMTSKAIDLLSTGNDDGFFLMIEGAHIDKNNHSNKGEEMKEAMTEFDKAIKIALDYAKADGHTLVIVTADHETGGIKEKKGEYVYTKTSHSSADVPLRVYGSDLIIENGQTICNFEIPMRVAYTLGFTEAQFPYEVSKR